MVTQINPNLIYSSQSPFIVGDVPNIFVNYAIHDILYFLTATDPSDIQKNAIRVEGLLAQIEGILTKSGVLSKDQYAIFTNAADLMKNDINQNNYSPGSIIQVVAGLNAAFGCTNAKDSPSHLNATNLTLSIYYTCSLMNNELYATDLNGNQIAINSSSLSESAKSNLYLSMFTEYKNLEYMISSNQSQFSADAYRNITNLLAEVDGDMGIIYSSYIHGTDPDPSVFKRLEDHFNALNECINTPVPA